MNLVLIDNHDSFSYNLVELCRQAMDSRNSSGGSGIYVMQNDCIDQSMLIKTDKIIISPGPGLPSETPDLYEIIKEYGSGIPILGICLGFQAIIECFGGTLRQMDSVRHGIVSYIDILDNDGFFEGIVSPFPAGRYHSWVADKIPDPLRITAWSEGLVMAVRHKKWNVQGVQFHPESFMTPLGLKLMQNWLRN